MEAWSAASDADGPATGPASWSDARLVLGLRADEPRAYLELYARFTPMLMRFARHWHVGEGERNDVATDALSAVALVLRRPDAPIPDSLSAYVVTAFKRTILNRQRTARRRAVWEEPLTEDAALVDPHARPHAEVVSEPVTRLAEALETHTTPAERQLLRWLGDRVPQREIASWLGISHGAARVRVHRLRERFREIARRYVAALAPDEREDVEAYLARLMDPPATPRIPASGAAAAPRSRGHRHDASP